MSGIDDMISSLRKLGKAPADVAKEAAPLVEKALRATAAAGTDPEGRAWAPRKRGGGRVLVNAAAAISTKAIGPLVVTTLEGVEVFHQHSKSHQRRIIPDGGAGTPESVAAAIDEAASRVFARAMGGR
jgi:hypothetical protein